MDNSGQRIQKVLSDNGILSRRKAEDAILQKRITVNGRLCKIGQKINPRRDIVALDGVRVDLRTQKEYIYLMLNKPRGYVTTTSDELGRQCVMDLVHDAPAKVYPVGRLDRNSEGLLLFTNDGKFANEMMHPSGHVTKTYRVTVDSMVSEDQIIALSVGVKLDDGFQTSPAVVHVLTREEKRSVLQITVHEGHNRLIRRSCEAVGMTVVRLKRTSIGPLKLGMLKPSTWRMLKPSEVIALKGSVHKTIKRNRQKRSEDRKSK